MEEKEKVLMSVTHTEDGTGVKVLCENFKEMFYLCLSLVQTIEEYPLMKTMIDIVKNELNNPEFKNLVEKSSVSVQDFNEILKNLK